VSFWISAIQLLTIITDRNGGSQRVAANTSWGKGIFYHELRL